MLSLVLLFSSWQSDKCDARIDLAKNRHAKTCCVWDREASRFQNIRFQMTFLLQLFSIRWMPQESGSDDQNPHGNSQSLSLLISLCSNNNKDYVDSKSHVYTQLKFCMESFTQKINLLKMSSLSCNPRWREVCFYIRTDLEKFSVTSLAHQCFLCSEWVPSEWVQTADKDITIIHTTPVQQLTSCEVKSWACNKHL